MSEPGMEEYKCPVCGISFYLQQQGVKIYLCDEEQICYPPDDKYTDKNPECKIYYFCSEVCAEEKLNSISVCKPRSSWQKYMSKINTVSKETGIAGARVHNLDKK